MKILKKEDIVYLYCTGSLFFIFMTLKILFGVGSSSEEFLYDFFSRIVESI